ncbi:protein cutoff-like [Drosophila innubila]|uniref:protein cutoff-like n=1 Tax=Drosophila innubila TaxID=198719 RepID=UPI00148B690B|nr:protein cutoff-like [Drosophila innubila]
MICVTKIDGATSGTPQTLGYYRDPKTTEYPISLGKGNEYYNQPIPCVFEQFNCMKYLMPQRNSEEFDFCTNRGILVKMMTSFDFDFMAIKFRGCIYLKIKSAEESVHKREVLQRKLKQYLIVNTPCGIPDTNKSLDFNKQNYGTFSAKLGKFRLLYTADVIGVENSDPLGDLNDPDVLQQCKLTLVKLYPSYCQNWMNNYRMKRWLLQAHLVGIDQIKLAAYTSNGEIPLPITTESCGKLINEQEWCLFNHMTLLHHFLSEIKEVMSDVDCPYTTYVFELKNKSVFYECFEGKNKESFLDQEYIDFVLGS